MALPQLSLVGLELVLFPTLLTLKNLLVPGQTILMAVNLKEFDLQALYPKQEIRSIFRTFFDSSIGLSIQSTADAMDLSFFSSEDIANWDLEDNNLHPTFLYNQEFLLGAYATHCLVGLMLVKSVKGQNPPVGMLWKSKEEGADSGAILVT
ncbi:hypothetical protein TNCV_2238931 [Trichonephila clavipes]|nr:hypothetical protein TNCV_2238931 [Trichonephila clavipes]